MIGFAGAAYVAGCSPTDNEKTKHAPSSSAASSPCLPGVPAGRPIRLPLPPDIDATTATAAYKFQLDVLGNSQADNLAHVYCYVHHVAGSPPRYVEAPTIRVRQDQSIEMTLVDTLPPAGATARPDPVPSASATSDDGTCALLNDEGASPSPMPGGYMTTPRIPFVMAPMISGDTNFHTHGFHNDPDVDNVFKSLAMSAGGTCVYKFHVPPDQPPGTYYYHAHLHGFSDDQVGGGLAGAIVVMPSASPASSTPDTSDDLALPDAVLLIKDYNPPPVPSPTPTPAVMPTPTPTPIPAVRPGRVAFDPFHPPAYVSGVAYPPIQPQTTPDPCGGQAAPGPKQLAVNGVLMPMMMPNGSSPGAAEASDVAVTTSPDVPVFYQRANAMRYRVVNTSGDSYVNIRLVANGKYVEPFKVLARDGVPVNWDMDSSRIDADRNVPNAVERTNVFLAPSNRVDIFVAKESLPVAIIGAAGTGQWCTGWFNFRPLASRAIVSIRPLGGAAAVRGTENTVVRRPLRIARAGTTNATFGERFAEEPLSPDVTERAITFTEYDPFEFYVTQTGIKVGGKATHVDWMEHPFWLRPPGSSAPSPLPTGSHYQADIWVKKQPPPKKTVEIWDIYNATGEAHAFHIHQMTFVALKSLYEPDSRTKGDRLFLDSIALSPGTVEPPSTPVSYPMIQPSLTRIKIDWTHVKPGTFVFHCHMLFHEDQGMMGIVHLY
ncbi:MAG TPA: multicopper oxidase domain-containing protein [Candidatus Elarobacter sp.]